jgi:peptidoglycan/LPS O-acetylase OafA/YrhL
MNQEIHTQRYAYLDFLRGSAALWVLLYHFQFMPQPAATVPLWISPISSIGGEGVTLFFLVSSFSLMISWEKRETSLLSFYMNRFFRIAPLFVFVLAISLLRDLALGAIHGPGEIAANLLLVFGLVPGFHTSIVWAGWTIGIEILFYLVFPFIVKRFRDIYQLVILFLLSSLVFVVMKKSVLQVDGAEFFSGYLGLSIFKFFPVFILGMIVFKLWALNLPSMDKRKGMILLLTGIYLTFSSSPAWVSIFPDDSLFVAFNLSLVLLGSSLLQDLSVFKTRFFNWAGEHSYSIYLIHPIVIGAVTSIYGKALVPSSNLSISYLMSLSGVLLAVFLISATTRKFVELPGLALNKYLQKSMARQDIQK